MNQVCEISLVKSFGFSHNFKRIFLIQSNTFSFVMALCSRPRSIIDGDNKHRNHLRDNENEEDEDVEDDSDRLSLIENNQIDSFRVDNFLIYRMDRFDKVDRFFKLFYHYYYCDEGDRIAIIISDGIRPNPMKHSRLRIRISLINFFRFFIITIIIIIIVVVIKLINLSHKTIPKSISTRTYDTLMMNSDQNLLLLSPISSSSSSSSSSLSSPPKSALTLKFKCESRPSSSIFRITTPIKLLILSLLVLLQSFRCLNHQCRFQINRLLQIIFSSRQIITDISNEQRSKDRLRQHRQIISSLILINFIGSYLLQQPLIVVAMINQNHIKSNQIEEYSIKNIFSRTDPSISASLIMNTDSRRNFSSKFLHQRYTDSIELKRLKRSNNLHRHHHQHHPHYLDLFNQSHQSNLRSMSMMLGKNMNRNSRLLSDNNLSQTYHHQHQLQHRFLNHPRLSSPYRINNNNNNKQSHTRTSTSTSTPLITQTKSSPSVTNHSKPRHSVIPSTLNWSSRLGASSLKPLLLSSKSFAALQNNTLFGRATMIKSNSMSDQRTQMKMNQRITQRQCPEGPPKQWDQRLNAASKALLAPVVFYGQLISLAEDYGGRIGATFRSIRFIKPDLKTITNKNHYRYLSGNGTEHLDDDDENDALINLLGAKNQSKNHEIHIKLYFVREQNETIGSTLCPLFMKNIWDKLRTKERYILFAHRQVLFSRDYKISTSSSTKVNPFINNNNARSVPDDNWYNQATTQHRHKQHQKLYLNPFHHSSSSGSPSAHINNHAGQHHQLISLVAYAEPEILNRTTGRLVRKILCKGCAKPAKAYSSSEPLDVEVRRNLTLACRVDGNPTPWIEWYRNGKQLRNRKRITIHTRRRVSILTITRASIRRDSGIYECRAMNVVSKEPSIRRFRVFVSLAPGSSRSNRPRHHHHFKHRGKSPMITDPFHVSETNSEFLAQPCPIASYCLNGGTCSLYETVGEYVCQCADGYRGQRCEFKDLYKYPVQKTLLDFDLSTRMLHSYLPSETNNDS